MISEKIVVIDDDPRMSKSLRIALPEYEIVDFNNGKDALDYLQTPRDINIILLDYMMPKMDGLSTLAEIRKIMPQDVGVILITAHGSKNVILEALRNRADDFIEKPVQMPELKEKIRAILKQKLHPQNLKKDKDDQISRIKRFIERNSSSIKLEHIAEELCLSPKYVSRLFNLRNDVNFREFKLKLKIDRAKTLLTETRLNINEISIDLGYQNSESFMRIFKRITNMTPTEYRKRNSQKVI